MAMGKAMGKVGMIFTMLEVVRDRPKYHMSLY